MNKFSNLKPEEKDKTNGKKVVYEDPNIKVLKYENWTITSSGKDAVVVIPYLRTLIFGSS